MKALVLCFTFLLFGSVVSNGQVNSIELFFNTSLNGSSVKLADGSQPLESDVIEITTLRFYISNLRFYKDNSLVFEDQQKYRLVDFANTESCKVNLDVQGAADYNRIVFNLGIDSLTNTAGVMGGDLDPTQGMYWSWQSGYINLKLEGRSKLCETRNNQFQFHLGGYQFPFNSLQEVSFKTITSRNQNIILDLDNFFDQVDLLTSNQVMSPSKLAMDYSEVIKESFKLKAP